MLRRRGDSFLLFVYTGKLGLQKSGVTTIMSLSLQLTAYCKMSMQAHFERGNG